MLEETFDSKGNHVLYEYAREPEDLRVLGISEENRSYVSQRYLRRIYYGNAPAEFEPDPGDARLLMPYRSGSDHTNPVRTVERYYFFEVLFNYGDLPVVTARVSDIEPYSLYMAPPASGTQEFTTERWSLREDPFSSYRAGFEIRTLRRCEQVLMIHHFSGTDAAGEVVEGVDGTTIVKSTDLVYEPDPHTGVCFLRSVKGTGYRWDRSTHQLFSASMPSVTFNYSEFKPQEQHYQSMTADGDDLPYQALSDPDMALVDLNGNGLLDLLYTSSTGFRYWQNGGNGHYRHSRSMSHIPAGVQLSDEGVGFADMAGNGRADLLVLGATAGGFYETTSETTWETFKPIPSLPSFNLSDPNVRLLDLTGDGLTDVLMTAADHFIWFRCLGEDGYAAPQVVQRIHNLDAFPDIYFNDPSGRVRLADMTGDGLNDIVLLHSDRIDYWPNLGYGRFGKRVTMARSPHLDYDYDPARLFLVDLDGSGCADLVYVGYSEVHFWFNCSGNGWSEEQIIYGTPMVTNVTAIQFADIFGTGTTALVWSYDFDRQPGGNYKFLDFCGGVKPYLLVEMTNSLGATTRVQYATSTQQALEDEARGRPWMTRLPFPVHVVERVETFDHITGNRFVTRYRYHHGYFDGDDREFRGFGSVEQWDTEVYPDFAAANLFEVGTNADASSHVPPVHTKTWFHTGCYLDREHVSRLFAAEYYAGDPQAVLLPDTLLPEEISLPDGAMLGHRLSPPEEREACRALRGSILRQEVYALDDTDAAEHPYTVTESNYEIRQLQPRQADQHGVFFIYPRESLAYHYDRHPDDPRIVHQMTLAVDVFGNMLQSAVIGYPRRVPQFPEQGQMVGEPTQGKPLITYTENRMANKPNQPDWYRIGVPVETCTYEITGIDVRGLPGFVPFTLDFIRDQITAATEIPYEDFASSGLQKRLMERVLTLYRANGEANTTDPTPLPLGEVESLGLLCESFKLALTPGLLDTVFSKVVDDPTELRHLLQKKSDPSGDSTDGGGYVELADLLDDPALADLWWVPSGRQAFDPDQFYLPTRTQNPFEETVHQIYDPYRLLVIQTEDPLHNVVRVKNNYRVMQSWQITVPNGNRAQVAFDTLGMVVGTAVMGKAPPEEPEGDSLDTFRPDLTPSEIEAFFADPLGTAPDLLGSATTRIIYDLEQFKISSQPVYVATLARETHVSDLAPGIPSKVQVSFLYSDGFGRELQIKVQAEPGLAPIRDASGTLMRTPDGALVWEEAAPRWVGTGRKIYNNKGKPIKQYEPFFDSTHRYETEQELVEWGVTPILFYDPLERVVATLHPNHTYDKVVFDPWQQATWDVNDTLTPETREDPTRDPDVGFYFQRLGTADYLPTWYSRHSAGTASERDAATKAAAHAGTSSRVHLDTLGRPFLTLAHNGWDATGAEQLYETRVEQDIEGQQLKITDARGNDVMVYLHRTAAGQEIRGYDLLGHGLYSHSMDAGERWMLNNVAGNPIRGWTFFGDPDDPQLRTVRTTYDALQRPKQLWVQQGDQPEFLAEQTVHGEDKTAPEATNHRGKVWRVYDQAGIVTSEAYDFKGNLRHSTRQLTQAYKAVVDWSGSPAMEEPIYRSETTYDALNRPIRLLTPHTNEILANIVRPIYNEANLLNQVQVNLRGAATATTFVSNIDYNAKGQRTQIDYGNGVTTKYTYEDETFRLIRLLSLGTGGGPSEQNLQYTYDPVGNITHIRDDSQPMIHHDGEMVEPRSAYTYDPLYRLITAQGREHPGQTTNNLPEHRPELKPHYDFNDSTRRHLDHPNDRQAMRNYTEQYEYDGVGNILAMIHQASGGDWTRRYDYAADSNRLLRTSLPEDRWGEYRYDLHGNMTQMPHLPLMQWDFKDQLQASSKQVVNHGTPETTYYVYDASGQRVRKVTERQNGTRMKERIYLGGFELYREYNGSGDTLTKKRETLHVMDGQQRIALVETQTFGEPDVITGNGPVANPLIRYQLNNHLGSAGVELDEDGKLISYEEFYPYGSTAYQAGRSVAEVSLKRYRYTGMERDEENALYYHGARYYAPWLGQWISCDPTGLKDGTNVYRYVRCNPVKLSDPTGKYAEGGHFYTVYFVALACGFDSETAFRIAVYAQLPDELSELEAFGTELELIRATIELIGATIELIGAPSESQTNLLEAQRRRDLSHRGLHALTGQSSETERNRTRQALRDTPPGKPEFGFLVHRFGDTYAHSIRGQESTMYSTGWAHTSELHAPDQIHERPNLYASYVRDLYRTLREIAERTPGFVPGRVISEAQLEAYIREITNIRVMRDIIDPYEGTVIGQEVDVEATERAQITRLRQLSERLLSRTDASERMPAYAPETEGSVSWPEFQRRSQDPQRQLGFIRTVPSQDLETAVHSAARKVSQDQPVTILRNR